ncbi:hypothetical protein J3458_020067 [Metarhizium acridum]|uniref:uncharacterized protein n=1 Tax=Metarhizium acridum TaxID=92637 RepID=UPI001C6C406C|nr:hypothetical protein J3458_020145 [Metarhizium acridum]KAG8409066.1 hypothetical protein J3458_020067 [Metarhizium acridum]
MVQTGRQSCYQVAAWSASIPSLPASSLVASAIDPNRDTVADMNHTPRRSLTRGKDPANTATCRCRWVTFELLKIMAIWSRCHQVEIPYRPTSRGGVYIFTSMEEF